MRWFTSRYTQFLESELAQVRERYRKELEEIKNTHAQELSRCILEANRGWAEADRLRLFLVPGLPAANRVSTATDSTPNTDPIEPQTPWLKLRKKIMDEDNARYNIEEAKRKATTGFPTPKPQAVPPVLPAQENEDAIRQ